MIKVKRIIIRNSGILLNDKITMELFKADLAKALDVSTSQVNFTFDELEGNILEDDKAVANLKSIQVEVEE